MIIWGIQPLWSRSTAKRCATVHSVSRETLEENSKINSTLAYSVSGQFMIGEWHCGSASESERETVGSNVRSAFEVAVGFVGFIGLVGDSRDS